MDKSPTLFRQRNPLEMFDWVLNMHLACRYLIHDFQSIFNTDSEDFLFAYQALLIVAWSLGIKWASIC